MYQLLPQAQTERVVSSDLIGGAFCQAGTELVIELVAQDILDLCCGLFISLC